MAEHLIKTDRVGLRNWSDADLLPMSRINADPKVMAYFPSTQDEAYTQKFIDSQQRAFAVESYCFFAADELLTGNLMGFIGILKFNFNTDFSPGIEIGWRLGHDYWGKGYATEGAKAVLTYAFHQLNIPEIWSFTTITNQRSEKVMQKIGMEKVGTFEHPKVDVGHQLRPHVLYHIAKP